MSARGPGPAPAARREKTWRLKWVACPVQIETFAGLGGDGPIAGWFILRTWMSGGEDVRVGFGPWLSPHGHAGSWMKMMRSPCLGHCFSGLVFLRGLSWSIVFTAMNC
jgi:hypothetical protein